MRNWPVVFGAVIAMGVGGLLALAPVASAAAHPSTIGVGCSDGGFYVTTATAAPGDTIELVGVGIEGTACTLTLGDVATAPATSFAGGTSLVITILRPGTISVSTSLPGTDSPVLMISAPEPLESAPADHLQQVPVPSSASCWDVDESSFRYGTAMSGGWSTSWAWWRNRGLGGAVCTRTLHYSQGLGTWTAI